MKGMFGFVLAFLAFTVKGVVFDFDKVLPLKDAVELAERGDAHGLYALAVNCAKGSTAPGVGYENCKWMSDTMWTLLEQAEEAGSAEASFLLGALCESRLYFEVVAFSSAERKGQPADPFDGMPKDTVPVSLLPRISRIVSTNQVFAAISALTCRRIKPIRASGGQPVTESTKLVYHPKSQRAYRYRLSGLTNEVERAAVRAHYLKAQKLGHHQAEAALQAFELSCVQMEAILAAKPMDADKLAEIESRYAEQNKRRDGVQERLLKELQRLKEERLRARLGCVVAQKLQSCEFLTNGAFKRDARFYLCLFSASWCGPCRAEMPRIAKMYAEILKDDPDFELIHFSRDQDDEKALAWAKAHDVKFPVVRAKGENPLELQTNGIPHLFILDADGALIEEGHPMKIFTEAKFKKLKGDGAE